MSRTPLPEFPEDSRPPSGEPFSPEDRARLDYGLLWWAKTHSLRALHKLLKIRRICSGRDSTLAVLCGQSRPRFAEHLDVTWDVCQSTPEKMMAEAFYVVARDQVNTVSWRVRGREFGDLPGEYHLCIEPQAPVASYRADFLLVYRGLRLLRTVDENGEMQDTLVPFYARAVVECDSHEWHERTRAQAEHDRRRDREMQALGYLVLRFTWSAIMANPHKVAVEAIQTLIVQGEVDDPLQNAA